MISYCSPYLFLPVVSCRGKRYRARVRFTKLALRFKKIVDEFPEGTVVRWFVGPLLMTVMIDESGNQ